MNPTKTRVWKKYQVRRSPFLRVTQTVGLPKKQPGDNMEFTREDNPTIMDGLVVRYKCGHFEINASRNGISTDGHLPRIDDQEDFDVLIEYFKRAFHQHEALCRRNRLSGRNDPIPEERFTATQLSSQLTPGGGGEGSLKS